MNAVPIGRPVGARRRPPSLPIWVIRPLVGFAVAGEHEAVGAAFEPLSSPFDERDRRLFGGRVFGQFAHREHRRLAFDGGISLDERDGADDTTGEVVATRFDDGMTFFPTLHRPEIWRLNQGTWPARPRAAARSRR